MRIIYELYAHGLQLLRLIAALFTSLVTSSAFAEESVSLENGLIAHYTFNGEITNNMISGQKTQMLSRNVTLGPDRFGRQQMAANLNGFDSYILSSPNLDLSNSKVTISLWVTVEGLNAANDAATMFNRWRSSSNSFWDDFSMFANFPSPDNFLVINWSGKDGNPSTDAYVVQNQFSTKDWTHIAITVSEKTANIYSNGKLARSITNKLAPRQLFSESASWGFGAQNDGAGPINFWRGRFDDIRIYNRQLSGEEVESIYRIENHPPNNLTLEPRPAKAHAILTNGTIAEIVIDDSGYGYSKSPLVIFESATGVGAIGFARISGGVVTAITVRNRGSGYSEPPVIKIASPPFKSSLVIDVSKVRVTIKANLGAKYQIESSMDLSTWVKIGEEFVARDELIQQEFDVIQTGKYFRLILVQ